MRRLAALLLLALLAAPGARADPARPVPPDYFGMHVLDYGRTRLGFPVGALRTWDAHPGLSWTEINAAPGVYDWRGFEAYLRLMAPLGAEDILYVFGRTPRWASARPDRQAAYGPGQCAPPAEPAHWDAFVEAVVRQARGRIRLWEIWNEPQDPHFWCGDVATMVQMARRARVIIRRLDPGARIVSPSTTGWLGGGAARWMASYLEQGGGESADIIGFHGYGDTVPERVGDAIAELRALLDRYGQGAKPIWNTEASWAGSRGVAPADPALRAAFVARSYLVQWPLGVQRFYWYAYDGGRWGGLRNAAGQPAADGVAWRVVREWMLGATMPGPCGRSGDVWRCELLRPGYRALVAWSAGGSAELVVPEGYVRRRDIDGTVRPLDGERIALGVLPVLVESGPPPQERGTAAR